MIEHKHVNLSELYAKVPLPTNKYDDKKTSYRLLADPQGVRFKSVMKSSEIGPAIAQYFKENKDAVSVFLEFGEPMETWEVMRGDKGNPVAGAGSESNEIFGVNYEINTQLMQNERALNIKMANLNDIGATGKYQVIVTAKGLDGRDIARAYRGTDINVLRNNLSYMQEDFANAVPGSIKFLRLDIINFTAEEKSGGVGLTEKDTVESAITKYLKCVQ